MGGARERRDKRKASSSDDKPVKASSLPKHKRHKGGEELSRKLTALWEEARRDDVAKERREELVDTIMISMQGRLQEVIFQHTLTRVVQMCLKYGTQAQRDVIFGELSGRIEDLAMSRYGKFLANKMLKYGTRKQRDTLVASFYGKVRKLLKHKEASTVVEYVYNEVANEQQRAFLVQELYDPQFRIMSFKPKGCSSLPQVVKATPTVKLDSCLRHMRDLLQVVTDKSLATHTMVQKVLLEYLENAGENDVRDMVGLIVPDVVRILHTRDGARVGVRAVTYGTAKERKVIIKSLKGVVADACRADYGYQVVLRILDAVDDTALVSKVVLAEIIAKGTLQDLAHHAQGSKPILFILAPQCSRYFSPQLISDLRKVIPNVQVSKKERRIRRQELLSALLPPLLELLKNDIYEFMTCPRGSDILYALLVYVSDEDFVDAKMKDERNNLIEALLRCCSGPPDAPYDIGETDGTENIGRKDNSTDSPCHPIDDPVAHRMLRQLCSGPKDKERAQGAREVTVDGRDFSSSLWDVLKSNVDGLLNTRGVYVLCSMLSNNCVRKDVIRALEGKTVTNQALLEELAKARGMK